MQPAQHATPAGRLVVLHQFGNASFLQQALARCFHKEAAGITVHLRHHQQHLGNCLGKDLHQCAPRSSRGCRRSCSIASAASVSAVSPDCVTPIVSVLALSGGGPVLNSLA